MTEKLTLHTASLRADLDKRTVTGLALPYGEAGRTNLGSITASRGHGVVLADRVTGNLEHDGTKPVGRMVASEETDAGLVMTFSISRTSRGDDLLCEIDDELRTGMSVEIDQPVIRSGALVGGTLSAVAFCTKPAFASAQVQMAASDMGDMQTEGSPAEEQAETPAQEAVEPDVAYTIDDQGVVVITVTPPVDEPDPTTPTTPDVPATATEGATTVTTPETASLAASAAGGRSSDKIKSVREFVERLTAAQVMGDRSLVASLADITQTGVGGDTEAEQWLGELWSTVDYERVIVPLMSQDTLRSYKVKGWKWNTKPTVAAYSGDKNAVPSNSPSTTPTEVTAQRIAGAHDFDRKFVDFGDQEFLQSYLRAMTASYAKVSDRVALDFLRNNSTVVTPGSVPTDVSPAAAAIVDAALSVLTQSRAVPTFAVVSAVAWRSLALTKNVNDLAFIKSSLGFDPAQGPNGSIGGFKIVPSADLDPVARTVANGTTATNTTVTSATIAFDASDVGAKVTGTDIAANTYIKSVESATSATLSQASTGTHTGNTLTLAAPGKVIVGTSKAATFHELSGSPVRVDVLNIANGGFDQGVFGYFAPVLSDSRGLAVVSIL